MLIDRFFAPQGELRHLDFGLKTIDMPRLGCFVALAGKNGSGKTRILRSLNEYIGLRRAHMANIGSNLQQISYYENIIKKSPPEHQELASWRRNIEAYKEYLAFANERIISSAPPSLSTLHFVPKNLSLADSRENNKNLLIRSFDKAKSPGFDGFENVCFAHIQMVQDREREATHQDSDHESTVIQEAKEGYESLQSLIELLLKTRLSRSKDSDATIFGKPLAAANLSDGQKVLIQFAVALHAQKGKLDNTIFLLDEPENHLHPSALIEFLDTLGEVAKNSQIWIATHSVPLLAYIAKKEPMSIWYVEDGDVKNAGSKQEKVLQGLLGDDEQIDNLNAFTSLPAQYAAISFAAQCLLAPKVAGGGKNDPQVAQIGGLLNFDAASPITLLDYGAGKSRLLSGLHELADDQEKNLSDSVNYLAFDDSDKDRADSLAAIEKVYGDDAVRHFLGVKDFFSTKDDASVDVVVMCNVLHEISPNEWLKLFDKHSLIGRSLKESGSLLIVEDQRIPTGEKAHQFGFLILDTPHLRTLFDVKEADMTNRLFETHDHQEDGRLKAHKISKQLLARLNADTRIKAIERLCETAKEEITALRQAEPHYRNGHLHGFWTQQFANAALWLDEQQGNA